MAGQDLQPLISLLGTSSWSSWGVGWYQDNQEKLTDALIVIVRYALGHAHDFANINHFVGMGLPAPMPSAHTWAKSSQTKIPDINGFADWGCQILVHPRVLKPTRHGLWAYTCPQQPALLAPNTAVSSPTSCVIIDIRSDTRRTSTS